MQLAGLGSKFAREFVSQGEPASVGIVVHVCLGLTIHGIVDIGQADVHFSRPFFRLKQEAAAALTTKAATRRRGRSVPAQAVFTYGDLEAFLLDSQPCNHRGAVKALTLGTVAMSTPETGQRYLKYDSAAQAGPTYKLLAHSLALLSKST